MNWFIFDRSTNGFFPRFQVTAQEVLRNTFHLEVGEAELVVIYDHDSPRVADLESQGFTKTLMDKLRQSFPTVAFLKGQSLTTPIIWLVLTGFFFSS